MLFGRELVVDDSTDVGLGNDHLVIQNFYQCSPVFDGFFCFLQFARLDPPGPRQEFFIFFLGLLRCAIGFSKFLARLSYPCEHATELAP